MNLMNLVSSEYSYLVTRKKKSFFWAWKGQEHGLCQIYEVKEYFQTL
jgi:hypothetical protein